MANFSDLNGLTLKEIKVIRNNAREDDSITFITEDDRQFVMEHYQDCCERVTIEDICGEIESLLHTPIISAYETSNSDSDDTHDSYTYTFYNINTVKGSVTIRWYGTSNGYYSEGVSFSEERKD